MICPKCQTYNDDDSQFCEKCGRQLKPAKENKTTSLSIKLLIVACIVLLVGFGLVSGMLLQKNSQPQTPDKVVVNQTNSEVVNSANWHEIQSFSGVSDDSLSFTTKGNRFKVVASATPLKNYDTNMMSVEIFENNNILSSGQIEWGSTEAVAEKEKTFTVESGSGTYMVNVYAKDLSGWTIKVYDYY